MVRDYYHAFQCGKLSACVPAVKAQKPSTSDAHPSKGPPSSFLHALQTTAWLPSSLGGVQPPSALFYPDSQILALLGEHVSYLACSVKDPNCLTALGITTEVTWSDVLRMLSSWAQQASFKTSIEQMTRIYTVLAAALESEQGAADAICDAFAQSPLIWLPAKTPLADLSNTTAAATPSLRGLPYDMTPQPHSTQNRRRQGRKVAFTTPSIQTQRLHSDTPAAPAYNPYTLTPGLKAPAPHRPTQGQFHTASGDTLRLWDSTGVLESVPADKLSIRIVSAIYSNDAVMQFLAEGLIRKETPQSSPIRQLEELDGAIDGSASVPPSTAGQRPASPQPQQLQEQKQQQQQQQQQQLPGQTLPSSRQPLPAAPTVAKAKPARVALEDYIDRVSSDDEAERAAAEQDEPQLADAAHAMDEDTGLSAPPQKGEAASTAETQAVTAINADSTAQQQNSEVAGPVDAQANDLADPPGQAQDGAPAQTDAAPAAASTQAEEAAQPGPASPPAPPPAAPQEPAPLILAEPTCQEYCQALAAIAEPLPPAVYPMQLTKVLAILNRWSRMVADSSLEDQEVSQLQDMLKNVKAFPIAGQQWVSLADGLILNDEPELARLFEGAQGVALLHVPQGPERYTPSYAQAVLHSCKLRIFYLLLWFVLCLLCAGQVNGSGS